MRRSLLLSVLVLMVSASLTNGCSVRKESTSPDPDTTADVAADVQDDGLLPDVALPDQTDAGVDGIPDTATPDVTETTLPDLPETVDESVEPPKPIPLGEPMEFTIPEGGASLLLPGLVGLEFPEGALPENLVVVATQIEAPVSTDFEAKGAFFQFGPSGLEFDAPVLASFPFDVNDPASAELGLIGQDSSGNWYAIPVQLDWENGLASAEIPHFSPWGIGFSKKECMKDSDCYGGKITCQNSSTLGHPHCSPLGKCYVVLGKCSTGLPVCMDGLCNMPCTTKLDCPGKGKPFCQGDSVYTYQCQQIERPFLPPLRLCAPKAGPDCGSKKQECVSGQCVGACVPNCAGRECGSDGCAGDGTCGFCNSWEACDAGTGQCNPVPQCANKQCGTDMAGGSCGTCANGQVCNQGTCCTPNCTGKNCGSDGCGGSCGECASIPSPLGDLSHCQQGQCACMPYCQSSLPVAFLWVALPTCGPDLCGGSCGTCPSGQTCTAGQCTPCEPKCGSRTCGPDLCGGTCGTCLEGQECLQGQCSAPVCGDGTCHAATEDFCACPQDCLTNGYFTGAGPACGCDETGGPIFPNNPPQGFKVCYETPTAQASCYLCAEEQSCDGGGSCGTHNGCGSMLCGTSPTTGEDCGSCGPNEQCVWGVCEGICVPQCADKECGWDGCQGTCGLGCAPGEYCVEGTCEAFQCAGCDQKECGWDNCQNFCGACPEGEHCNWQTYQCVPDCVPECGNRKCGPNGCGGQCGLCEPGFHCNENMGTCVACQPDCYEQQECGSDGCGGYCGVCPAGSQCVQGFYCQEVCIPNCQGKECGSDGCQGYCGDPAPNGTCTNGLKCIQGLCDCEHETMCAGKECGYEDACGVPCGANDGGCPGNEACNYNMGLCEPCMPDCWGGQKQCGDDGCGGSCGECTGGDVCMQDSYCAAP